MAAGRAGGIVSVDRDLPLKLKSRGSSKTVTVTVEPGQAVDADTALARVDGNPSAVIERLVRGGVAIAV